MSGSAGASVGPPTGACPPSPRTPRQSGARNQRSAAADPFSPTESAAAPARHLARSAAACGALVAAVALHIPLLLAAGPADYHNDFSNASPGEAPKDVQTIGGAFTVVEVGGDKAVELPGVPLDISGLLFGPADQGEVDAKARVWAESSGRRFPEFGMGLGDVGGFRLMVLPGQKRVELRHGEDVVKSVELAQPWRSGAWTWMRLRVVAAGAGRWSVEAKAWPEGAAEPQAWQVSHEITEAPAKGRASVWGVPFSGKPIRFDDLTWAPASAR